MKLSSYQNPISGKSGSLFDLGGLWSLVLGVFVLLMVWVGGQKLVDMLNLGGDKNASTQAQGGAEGYNQVPVMRIL